MRCPCSHYASRCLVAVPLYIIEFEQRPPRPLAVTIPLLLLLLLLLLVVVVVGLLLFDGILQTTQYPTVGGRS